MNAFEFDKSFSLPRLYKKSHNSNKDSIQNNSDAKWEWNNRIEIVTLGTEIYSPVLVSPHYNSGSHSEHTWRESEHSVHYLIPLPPMLEVSIGDDLECGNQSPARPHEPSVKGGHFFELFWFDTTSVTFQNNVKKSVVVLVESQLVRTIGIESIDHMNYLVEGYYIVVLLCRLQKPRSDELCSFNKRFKRSHIWVSCEYFWHVSSLAVEL